MVMCCEVDLYKCVYSLSHCHFGSRKLRNILETELLMELNETPVTIKLNFAIPLYADLFQEINKRGESAWKLFANLVKVS